MSVVIDLCNVNLSFALAHGKAQSNHQALKNINMKLEAGERLGIIGKNGSGKSTLLRVMAKILKPDTGVVTWHSGVAPSLLSLGIGFKSDLSGRDNAYIACILRGMTRKDSLLAIGAIEEFCELGAYFDEPIKFYSVGMRARLGFGTALASKGNVILIDEVLSVGDVAFRQKALEALKGFISDGHAMVLVSHSDQQIASMCNRAIVLDRGSVVFDGAVNAAMQEYGQIG